MSTSLHICTSAGAFHVVEISTEQAKEGGLIIGRDPAADVTIDDGAASRFHARLSCKDQRWYVVDLESSNGTYLNNDPIRESELAPGDLLAIGDCEIRLEAAVTTASESVSRTQVIHRIDVTPEDLDGKRSGQVLGALHSCAPLLGRSAEENSARLEKGLRLLVEGIDADRGAILISEEDGWLCRSAWSRGGTPMHGFVLSHTIHSEVMQSRRAVISRDTTEDLRFADRRSVVGDEIRSVIAAPIPVHEGIGGILYLDRLDGDQRPFGNEELWGAGVAAGIIGASFSVGKDLVELSTDRKELVRTVIDSMPIIGSSSQIDQVRNFIRKTAPTDGTVLIRGETGTGKELVARAIHYQGSRAAAPFIALNCAAIPENLVESELFGHEKGAFTGADQQQPGKFEAGSGGTVFLDEIGELPTSAQSKMLRLLEEKRLERVGGNNSIDVDVRIVAATHRDLQEEVAQGRFREDLYYRLAVLEVVVPPLRDRPSDIDLLAEHFLDLCCGRSPQRKQLSPDAMTALRLHSWPGNVRQLRNVIESAVILTPATLLEVDDLRLDHTASRKPGVDSTAQWQPISLKELEKDHISLVLDHVNWNKKRAAELLGIERSTLYSRIRNLQLEPREGTS
ncbi:MAG TPA: FHA domain-containing protein [Planctomycetes bacterium]|nr:FHA domain-containing protein [Planctomycetota bacterium]HIK81864.1 FHA domain-containing protein [Planctomycetota bacterium]